MKKPTAKLLAILTEADLRAMCLPLGFGLALPMGTQLTPAAQDYCRERDITVEFNQAAQQSVVVPGKIQQHSVKPEHMTHLNGSELVPKTDPHIALRGKLDSLQALMLQGIAQASELGRQECADGLRECFDLAQAIMAAEVTEMPLPPPELFGLDSAGLRRASHERYVVPHAGSGGFCLALNYLRTQVRETELAACAIGRLDLIEALNRMSSAVYLLFMKEAA